jgi:hypothetical protein
MVRDTRSSELGLVIEPRRRDWKRPGTTPEAELNVIELEERICPGWHGP